MDVLHHLQQDLFRHHLNGRRQIHFTFGERRFRLSRRSTQQPVEAGRRHRQPRAVIEELHIQPKRSVRFDVEQAVADQVRVLGLTIRRESHQLVFARVHFEAAEVRECRIQHAERMREPQFVGELNLVPLSNAPGRSGPFTDTVHGEDRGLIKWRRKERARRVRLVMFGKDNPPREPAAQSVADFAAQMQLLPQPDRQRRQKRSKAARRECQIRFNQPVELQQRLLVEADIVQPIGRQPGFVQTVVHRQRGKAGVMLDPREPLFLRRGDDLPIHNQGGRGVVVERGDAEHRRHVVVPITRRVRSRASTQILNDLTRSLIQHSSVNRAA